MTRAATEPQIAIRVVRNTAGIALVVLGIVGLFLPFLQGILFTVLGLGLIDLPFKRRAHRWLRHRVPCYRGVALRYQRAKRARRQRALAARP